MSHPRRSLLAILLVLFALALQAAAVRADMAPPQPPLGGGVVPGQETTRVRMQAETVLLELPSSSAYPNWQASVTATFTMRNQGPSAESMQARFPMFMTQEYLGVEVGCPGPDTNYPAVQNFRALVEGKPVEVQIDEVAMSHYENNQESTVKKPCWANFPVTFPPDRDVQVEIRYLIQGQLFGHGITNYLGFPYILTTGRGWQGTIGSADITVRLPYPASDLNVMEISQGGQISGNEVRWHFADFEPDSNTAVWVFNPGTWQALQRDEKAVQANPQDGEAWGRIGKDYKQAFLYTGDRGFRSDPAGLELFQRSREAYQKSVALLPKDADWHYGYGDLLCETALWNYIAGQLPSNEELLTGCAQQLQLALQINPRHAQAIDLLRSMSAFQQGIVSFSGDQPDFLILTPGNYHTPTPWPSPAPSLAPTQTPTTAPTETDTPPASPSALPTSTRPVDTTTPAPTAKAKNGLPVCGAVLLPLLAALWFGIRRRSF